MKYTWFPARTTVEPSVFATCETSPVLITCQTWLLPFFVLSLFLRGSRVPIRYTRRRFRGLQPLCASGVTSFTVMISRPAA